MNIAAYSPPPIHIVAADHAEAFLASLGHPVRCDVTVFPEKVFIVAHGHCLTPGFSGLLQVFGAGEMLSAEVGPDTVFVLLKPGRIWA